MCRTWLTSTSWFSVTPSSTSQTCYHGITNQTVAIITCKCHHVSSEIGETMFISISWNTRIGTRFYWKVHMQKQVRKQNETQWLYDFISFLQKQLVRAPVAILCIVFFKTWPMWGAQKKHQDLQWRKFSSGGGGANFRQIFFYCSYFFL